MTQKEKKQQKMKREKCISNLRIISIWLNFSIERHEKLTVNEMQKAKEWIDEAIEVLEG